MRDHNPQTYIELVKEFQAIENYFRLIESHQHQSRNPQQVSNNRSQPSRAPASNTTTVQVHAPIPSTATGTHAGPMDVSVARGSLSAEEKQHRRDKGLCLYCGQSGHLALSCSNSKRNRRLHVAEINVAAAPDPSPSPSPSSPAESGNEVSLN